MNILIGNKGKTKVFLAYEDEKIVKEDRLYDFLKEKEIFKGECGEIYSHIDIDESHIIYLGLGKKSELDYEAIKIAFFKLGKELIRLKITSAGISLIDFKGLDMRRLGLSIADGLLRSEYRFDKYLSNKKDKACVEEFYIATSNKKEVEEGVREGKIIVEGIFLARDLSWEPSNVMTPTRLASEAKSKLEPLGIEVEVFDKEEIEKLNMKAFLAVARGSEEEPKLIVMKYKGGGGKDNKLALVGKGLTYDTGGYSLKGSDAMRSMFTDMAGGASVIGAMYSIAKAGLKKNVIGVIAACENSISGDAQKPGDIISSMSGKTIEVDNTDAEGRLTLADALWYAATVVKADKIIDVATLTYDVQVALSDIASGIVTNDRELVELVKKSSELAGEKVVEFPIFKEYEERAKSERADLINTGSGRSEADQVVAGVFLREFTNNVPWVHIDLGGRAYLDRERGYLPKGVTGIPTNTLYNIVKYID